MKYLKFFSVIVVTIVFLISCNLSNKKSIEAYQTKFVNGSTNNKIEILDFGGTGQPILFLTGLGNSAHVYVDFAPRFSDNFHVYAMTRRGFGASEQTVNGYSIDTLSMDILAVTKALNFDRVILIGHSIAGDEISRFASSYPDKVEKVIYLDAAHDRTNYMTMVMPYIPAFPIPTAKDSSSLGNLKAFIATTMGVLLPDEEIKSTSVFSEDGKYLKDITPGSIIGRIISGVERPNYKNINCPALSIYAIPTSINAAIPTYASLDDDNKKKADTLFTILNNWRIEQIEVFKNEVNKGIVKEIEGAHHYVFISNEAETEKLIRDFLK